MDWNRSKVVQHMLKQCFDKQTALEMQHHPRPRSYNQSMPELQLEFS